MNRCLIGSILDGRFEPPNISRESPSFAFHAFSMALDVLSMTFHALRMAFDVRSLAFEAQSMTFEPPNMACHAQSIDFEPQTFASDAPSITLNALNIDKNPRNFNSGNGLMPF